MIMIASPGTLEDLEQGKYDKEEVKGLFKEVQDRYKDFGDSQVQLIIPFLNLLLSHKKYLKPLVKMKKSYNTAGIHTIAHGALSLRMCCEAIVKLGFKFNTSKDIQDRYKSAGIPFEDKIKYLDEHHPEWMPHELLICDVNLGNLEYFISANKLDSNEFAQKSSEQITKSLDLKKEVFGGSSSLLECYKNSNNLPPYGRRSIYQFIQ